MQTQQSVMMVYLKLASKRFFTKVYLVVSVVLWRDICGGAIIVAQKRAPPLNINAHRYKILG